jgi:hypothetical protein
MAERVIGGGGRAKKPRRTRPVLAWRDNRLRARIDPLKALIAGLVALGSWVVVLLCVDVWEHDMTLIESVKNTPRQMLANVGALMGMAWQYKLGAVLVIAVVATIFYIRQVPTIRSRN